MLRKREEWEEMYRAKNTPWDGGKPDPYVVKIIKGGLVKPCDALELGCGTGDQSIFLSQENFCLTAVDFSATAIYEARRRAEAAKAVSVDFIVADLLHLPLKKKFGFVIDRRVFHFLDPEERAQYVQNLKSILCPGGWYLLIVSSDQEKGEDRYHFSKESIYQIFGNDFVIRHIKLVVLETHVQRPKSYLCLMERK